MKKRIIIINGSGGVGKDTFVEFCSNFTGVKNISSVDKVKEAARILVGWNGEKNDKTRKLLSDLKQLSIDYNNYPLIYIDNQTKEFMLDDSQSLMFIHIRESSEIEKVKNAIGAKTLLITSNRVAKIETNKSDANVEDFQYDYYIENDGTLDELKEKARVFVMEG